MQEKNLFEYAIIRVVPKVEREEFLNAGVIVYCNAKNFLKTIYLINESRLQAFCENIDLEVIENRLQAFDRICKGKLEGGQIGQLSKASRFRWLTAARSTVVQTSAVHPGLCADPEETLLKLFVQFVQ